MKKMIIVLTAIASIASVAILSLIFIENED